MAPGKISIRLCRNEIRRAHAFRGRSTQSPGMRHSGWLRYRSAVREVINASNISNSVRILIRAVFIVVGVFCVSVSALLFLAGSKQVAKNKAVFADMKDCVSAVQAFAIKEGRLPDHNEFTNIIATLPIRYHRYNYELSDSPEKARIQIEGLKSWPKGGWVLYFWRGEWHEWYSSWNGRYSMANQLTIWNFGGPIIIGAALLGLGCFFAIQHKRLRKNTEMHSY
jgi:hypothetical protein